MAEVTYAASDYHVGWICAVSIEYVAACAMLDSEHAAPDLPPDDYNVYTCGKIGNHLVVIACLPLGKYGLTSATSVAKDMQRSFPTIDIRLMVGIGGGAPTADHDIRLGDVVVSIPAGSYGGVIYYESGKTIQSQPLKRTGCLSSPPTKLLNAAQHLRMLHKRYGHKLDHITDEMLHANPRLREEYQKPSETTDVLFKSSVLHGDTTDHCSSTCVSPENIVPRADRQGTTGSLVVHYGLIASADKLMKDAELRDSLAKSDGILCFEMEAAGLMDWFGCLIIRGICDYSDSHKSDMWQGYAAATAAAYAKDLLQSMRAVTRPQTSSTVTEGRKMPATSRSSDEQDLSAIARDSFQFRTMHDRECGVKDAEEGTFRWILNGYSQEQWDKVSRGDRRSLQKRDPAGLVDWLETRSGVFRIIGKAGSGKSTLMKLLTSEETCTQAIQKWAAPSKALVLRYFAWKAGDALQRSQIGFLRTALYQAFEQEPDLVEVVLKAHEKSQVIRNDHSYSSLRPEQWSDFEIKRFWSRLSSQSSVKLCIFLDGLDEFNESMLDMARFVSDITETSKSSIKMVISGRYEPHFDEVVVSKHFRLHEWTMLDIKILAENTLRRHHIVNLRATAEPKNFRQLVETVVNRAEGVFVWVTSALDSLLKGMIESDTTSELLDRLNETPVELNDLYGSILKDMSPGKLEEVAAFFSLLRELRLRPLHRSSLHTFTLAYEYSKDDPMWMKDLVDQKWSSIEKKVDRLSRRVSVRCSQFVCLSGQSDRPNTIQYMHRSAYEFLVSKEAKRIFDGTNFDSFQWNEAVCLSEIVFEMFRRRQVEGKSWAHIFFETLRDTAESTSLRDSIPESTFWRSRPAESRFLLDSDAIRMILRDRPVPKFPYSLDQYTKVQFLQAVSSWVEDSAARRSSTGRSDSSQRPNWLIEHLKQQQQMMCSGRYFEDKFCLNIVALTGFDVTNYKDIFPELTPLEKINLITSFMIGWLDPEQHKLATHTVLEALTEDDKEHNRYIVNGVWHRALTLLQWISRTRRRGLIASHELHRKSLELWTNIIYLWILTLVKAGADVNQVCVWDDKQGVGFSISALEVFLSFQDKSTKHDPAFRSTSAQYHFIVQRSAQILGEMRERGARAFVCFDKTENAKIPPEWHFPYVLNSEWIT